MKITRVTNLLLLTCATAAGLAAADSQRDVERFQAVASAITGFSAEDARTPDVEADSARKVCGTRSARESMAIVTAGATAGASIGAATRKGTQAIVVGAIVGGIAGLIYDRATAHPRPEAPALDPQVQPQPDPAR